MHKSDTKCNETLGKWYKNKHGASKITDTFETYQPPRPHSPATKTLAPHLLPLSRRRRPCAHAWRQRLWQQASRCCLAINALWPPSTQPNRCQPPRPAIGPAVALALNWPCMRRGRREHATRSRACACLFLACPAPFCTASSVHSRDTHA
jgi:hypothetical protein